MIGLEPSSDETDTRSSQIPAESHSSIAIGAAKEETESHAKPKSVGLSEAEAQADKGKEVEKEAEKENAPALPVLYKVQYLDIDNTVVFSKEGKEPMGIQNNLSVLGKSVIEVISKVRILGPYESKTINAEKEEPLSTNTIVNTSLKINSPAIITALQSVIEYYPGLSFSEQSNTIPEPYGVLYHHEEELKAYRDRFRPDVINSKDELCRRSMNAYGHLGILKDVLSQQSGTAVEAERQRHARGVATFEMLWLLFKPGTDIYWEDKVNDHWNACVVSSVSDDRLWGRSQPLKIHAWRLIFDGDKVGRRSFSISQPVYDGEKEISSLEVYPCEFLKEESEKGEEIKPLRQKLEERGKMYYKLAQKECMNYNGFTSTWPKRYIKGLTMVDTELYYKEECPEYRPSVGELNDIFGSGVSECYCDVCSNSKTRGIRPKTPRFSNYDDLYPEETKTLTNHQYFICGSEVYAYIFKNRAWASLYVSCFSNPTFDTGMIDTLVMEEPRRRLIKALAKNYQTGTDPSSEAAYEPWVADFVAGKGEGKIFLLHGKPGVGKTYTAECIAEYTERPLLSLAISDIGTEPEQAERRLNDYFERAKIWNAILLIDEADIYMERREVHDLTRNSLVSSFLRAMESCQSILFLTTNRIGSFDDAFVSRIHVSLYYPDFSESDRRQVWQIFFDKLARDRKNIMHIPVETVLYAADPEVTSLKWNGREIRNAFQTAVSLADFDGADEDGKITLRKRHIQQIVRMSGEFKDYLNKLHRGDEAKRADRQRIRYDDFDEKTRGT